VKVVFLADECVSNQTVIFLEKLGCNVTKVQDIGLEGKEDEVIFKYAQERNITLVTYDRGFGNIRKYAPSSHNGIIVIKVYNLASLKNCHEVLKKLLEKEKRFKGTLFVVNEKKYRKREKP